jgi:hypothetical protein
MDRRTMLLGTVATVGVATMGVGTVGMAAKSAEAATLVGKPEILYLACNHCGSAAVERVDTKADGPRAAQYRCTRCNGAAKIKFGPVGGLSDGLA